MEGFLFKESTIKGKCMFHNSAHRGGDFEDHVGNKTIKICRNSRYSIFIFQTSVFNMVFSQTSSVCACACMCVMKWFDVTNSYKYNCRGGSLVTKRKESDGKMQI